MIDIHPFRAITPINGFKQEIRNKIIYEANQKFDSNDEFYENKFVYLNKLLEKKLLHEHSVKSFYCCKISNKDFSIVGLVGLINSDLVNKFIFRHERCINIKEKYYKKSFKKHKTQTSPIILIHEDNYEINEKLNKLVLDNIPFLKINDDENNKYEIWPIYDFFIYKNLYKNINTCLIADGHHRLSSISSFGKGKLISAFFTSIKYIKSSNIYREYLDLSDISISKLFTFLNSNFNLIKISNLDNIYKSNEFFFRLDSFIYKIKNFNSNNDISRDILEFLDININYNNGKLNFYNYPFDSNNKLLTNKESRVGILIPAYKIQNKIEKIPLYPPHSTLFYPKLPEGLISLKLEI